MKSSESEVFNSIVFIVDNPIKNEIDIFLRRWIINSRISKKLIPILKNRELSEKYNFNFYNNFPIYNPDYVFKMLKSEEDFYEMLQEEREMKINQLL